METNLRNVPTARKLRLSRVAGVVSAGILIVAAGAADAKNGGGGSGGGGKGGGGGGNDDFDNGSFGHGEEIIRELVKFSDEQQPQRLGGSDDDDDNQLRLPTYQRVSPKIRYNGNCDAYCHAKYNSYNSITGKYTGYSGRKHYCVVPCDHARTRTPPA